MRGQWEGILREKGNSERRQVKIFSGKEGVREYSVTECERNRRKMRGNSERRKVKRNSK